MEIVEAHRGPVTIIEPCGAIDTSGAPPFGDCIFAVIFRFAQRARRSATRRLHQQRRIPHAGLSMFPIAAALLFNSFILISGVQIITSRLLDSRQTFTVGLALVLSLSRDVFSGFYQTVPDMLQAFVSSGFVMGVSAALLLNAIFRIGVRVLMALTSGTDTHSAIHGFLEQQGARWGAQHGGMKRAIFGTTQAVESVADHFNPQGRSMSRPRSTSSTCMSASATRAKPSLSRTGQSGGSPD
jgi:hypothetical protein